MIPAPWISIVVSCFVALFTGYTAWQKQIERNSVRPIITRIEKISTKILGLNITNTATYKIVILKVYIKKWLFFRFNLTFKHPTDSSQIPGMVARFATTRFAIFDEDVIKVDYPPELLKKPIRKIYVKTTAGTCKKIFVPSESSQSTKLYIG